MFRNPASLSDKNENQPKITVMKVAVVVIKVRSEVCGSNWLVSGWGVSLGLRQYLRQGVRPSGYQVTRGLAERLYSCGSSFHYISSNNFTQDLSW